MRGIEPYFPRDAEVAVRLQRRLAATVVLAGRPRSLRRVAGVDVAYEPRRGVHFGAVVLVAYPGLEVEEIITGRARTTFPYVPGLLSFREAPLCYKLLSRVRDAVDVLIVDGQGIAHPRRFGIASHLGVLLDLPTIGCAKSLLVGEAVGRLAKGRGARVPLVHRDERVGTALRTRAGVKPVFISLGHRSRLKWAEGLILTLAPRYRIPEPIRVAHHTVTQMRNSYN